MDSKVFIIAEIGVNHNGSIALAKKMIEAAADAGADAVKIQTFITEKLVAHNAEKAEYQKEASAGDETQYAMLKRLELDIDAHRELIASCRARGVAFISAPFDLESIDLLVSLGVEIIKVPSGEITNLPYLRKIGGLGKRLIISTGMADLSETGAALAVLNAAGTPNENITVLHCNTEYPTPMEDVNLRAMLTISDAFPDVKVGYSDHTLGSEVSVAAVALGGSVIEKHFTLDKEQEGPDHKASMEPGEFGSMVQAIRNIEKALGHGIKEPSPSEMKNLPIARKNIVAAVPIFAGEVFTESNLAVKRTGREGVSPMRWDDIIGTRAQKDYQPDEMI